MTKGLTKNGTARRARFEYTAQTSRECGARGAISKTIIRSPAIDFVYRCEYYYSENYESELYVAVGILGRTTYCKLFRMRSPKRN